MNYISDVLFWISTGMLVPVIILLIFFFLRALLLLGGFFGQYLVKRKTGAEIREQMVDCLPCLKLSVISPALAPSRLRYTSR